MTTIYDTVRTDVAAWWDAHPGFREKYARFSSTTADSLAKSVVHWHHNVEAARRYGKGSGGNVESATFFLREYARSATEEWLLETQDKLDALGDAPERWYERRDLEFHVYALQRALDNFKHNDRAVREERQAREAQKEVTP